MSGKGGRSKVFSEGKGKGLSMPIYAARCFFPVRSSLSSPFPFLVFRLPELPAFQPPSIADASERPLQVLIVTMK